MLKEIKNANQNEDNTNRRIFLDNNFSLYIWYDKNNIDLIGFQLCYDIMKEERALTWENDRGFQNHRIEDDRKLFRPGQTPILTVDGLAPIDKIIELFISNSSLIEEKSREIIITKLYEYKKMGDKNLEKGV